jgi:asparagine synthase (glutamine-hydrolysing)
MCGIAGWVAPAASAPEERALQPMLDAMLHRGPDGAGSYGFSAERGAYRGVLGHRRLAIIDPNGSRQPMCDAEAGLALTFNGEIYNFRELRGELERHGHSFQRDSDTEVLLRAYQQWGTQCVHHLRGQFAFAVWDARAERLFLARDRFGEKPLYLHEANGALYFASEAKALLKLPNVPRDVDLSSVWDYLAYRPPRRSGTAATCGKSATGPRPTSSRAPRSPRSRRRPPARRSSAISPRRSSCRW